MTVWDHTTTTTTSYIYPSNKHKQGLPPSKIPLSGRDDVHNHSQMPFYWLFHSSPSPIEPVIDRLKGSLAEALELYRPVAGTVKYGDDDGNWYISTDNENVQGTPFIFEKRNTPYSKEGCTKDLLPRGSSLILPFGSSIFAVKITQFSCGTILLAGSMNHSVTDLHGFMDFMTVWSQLSRKGSTDLKNIPQDWSRSLNRFFPPLRGEPVNPFWGTASPTAASVLGKSPATPSSEQQVRVVVWNITKRSMARLKMDLSETFPSKKQWISSGDALTALMFGALTRAREKANIPRIAGSRTSRKLQTETIHLLCDCRSRALPQGENFQYFGNAVMFCKVTVPRAELLSPTFEATSRIALSIRNEMHTQLSPGAIANYFAYYDDLKAKKRCPYEHFPLMDALCTNAMKMDTQVDFGWGKSYKMSFCEDFPSAAGTIRVLPGKGPGEIAVMLSIEADAVNQLELDSLLNKYGTSRCQPSHL